MRNSKLLKLLALIFAFSLIAAACGDDDDDGGSSSSSDNSALSEESSDDDASSSDRAYEEVSDEDDHSDDDGHDHSDDEDHSDEEEAAGDFSDAVNGDGAELLESLIDNPPGPADDSLDPVVITMSNIEGTPVGSFPEIREGAAAAAKAFNENYGGMNGRPIDFQPLSLIHI